MEPPWGQPLHGWTPPHPYYSPGYWHYVPVPTYPIYQPTFPSQGQHQFQGQPVERGWRPPQRPSSAPPLRRSQRQERRELQLHRFLGGQRRPTAVWDVSQEPSTARRVTSRRSVERVTPHLLDQPATDPPVKKMRIVCDAFEWDININIPPRNRGLFVTIRLVLDAIYGTLHEPLIPEDWRDICPADRRKIYKTMLGRLAQTRRPSMVAGGRVLRIDCLSDRTVFLGLKPGGPSPDEWVLSLGPPRR